jgi:hypothetical protein
MPSPKVLDGMRQPRSVRLEEMRVYQDDNINQRPEPPESKPGVNVYVSTYRRYRVQVTAPHTYVDPATGRKAHAGKMLAAQFEDGVFRNDHHDPAIRKLIDEALQSNKYFGAFGTNAHFWLSSDQRARTEARRIQAALDTLRSMPKDAVDQFVAELRQGESEDHTLPADPTPARTVRPIPPAAQ